MNRNVSLKGKTKGKVVHAHNMKAYREVELQFHSFLSSALDRREWSASRPNRFRPKEGAIGAHWIGGWVGPRTNLDAVGEMKPSFAAWSVPTTPQFSNS
jgi:hypothetical protein